MYEFFLGEEYDVPETHSTLWKWDGYIIGQFKKTAIDPWSKKTWIGIKILNTRKEITAREVDEYTDIQLTDILTVQDALDENTLVWFQKEDVIINHNINPTTEVDDFMDIF